MDTPAARPRRIRNGTLIMGPARTYIATAVGVHPGFTGCLSLELSNLGEISIALQPGLAVCQLFIHKVDSASNYVDQSCFIGMRRPALGRIEPDEMATKLRGGQKPPTPDNKP